MTPETQTGPALTVGLVDLLRRRPELADLAIAQPLAEAVTSGA
jgi:hypothetical protein